MTANQRTAYQRGYYRETLAAAAFGQDGYVVWRPGGSLGLADLVAAKPGQLVLIQVKSGNARLADGWWNDLYKLAHWLGAVAVVADWPVTRKGMRLREITGPHTPHKQHWPCREFVLDEIAAAVGGGP